MTILKELRDAATRCTRPAYRESLQWTADHLEKLITELMETPNDEAMIHLNGTWSYAKKLLKNLPAEADPQPPMSGAPEPARLAA